jgi:hypothetical protein
MQGGVYLGVGDTANLQDNQQIVMTNGPNAGSGTSTFTMKSGFVLQSPAGGGPLLPNGETFTINGTTFQLSRTGNVPNPNVPVLISDSMSPAQVADALATAVNSAGVSGVSAVRDASFTLLAPNGGSSVIDHETFTVTVNGATTTFQLVKTGSATTGIGIAINDTMTAQGVATAIANAIANADIGITPVATRDGLQLTGADKVTQSAAPGMQLAESGSRVQLVGATTVTQVGVSGPPGLILIGSVAPNVAGNILYRIDDTAAEVATKIAAGLDQVFTAITALSDPNVYDDPTTFTTGKVNGSVLTIYGHNIVSSDLPFSSSLPGDEHGLDYSPTSFNSSGEYFVSNQTAQDRGKNNNHQGAYIDDIVVGFAGRGEMVTQYTATPTTPRVPNATITALPTNPDTTDPQHITTGSFQLDIRRGQEYAAKATYSNVQYPYGSVDLGSPWINLNHTFDINDRLVQAISLISRPATELVEGQTFSILTEAGTYTFEFSQDNTLANPNNIKITLSTNDTAAQVATKIAAAINGASITKVGFNVKAGLDTNGARVNLYGAVDVQSGPLGKLVFNSLGDATPVRVQGQTIIEGNTITNALVAGVAVLPQAGVDETGAPNAGLPGATPQVAGHTGSVANLPTPNSAALVPGITIRNNLITTLNATVSPTATGILFSGTPTGLDIATAVPFGRIVNNTVVGMPIGINVVNNASPTLLNNIVAQTTTAAIQVDSTSVAKGTVVKTSLYQSNSVNLAAPGLVESNAIVLQPNAPLFVDSAHGNYYLALGSAAIDSSLDSQSDRPAMIAVDTPLGIPASPVQAPDFDVLGQLRMDDPAVPNTGIGSNPYKDRGAIERADTLGPLAALANPLDNDAAGVDRSSIVTKVLLVAQTSSGFAIQLNDNGVGVDNTTVSASKFTVKRTVGATTTTLVAGTDFTLSYDTTNKIANLLPVQGIWSTGTYVITLDNSAATGIKDVAGNVLQGNQSNGTTVFTIQLSDTAPSNWQNPVNRLDVNNDGLISGSDAIIIINRLIKPSYPTDFPLGVIPAGTPAPPYIDVSGDGKLFPIDAIQVINYLNSHPVGTTALVATPAATSTAVSIAEPSIASTATVSADELDDTTSNTAVDQSVVVTGLAASVQPSNSILMVGPYGVVDAQATTNATSASGHVAAVMLSDPLAWSDDEWYDTAHDLDEVIADLTDTLSDP